MISASAAMEQISSGQIGQPAACSIESNMALSCDRLGRPSWPPAARGLWRDAWVASGDVVRLRIADANRVDRTLSSSTGSVDNFVDNRQANRWRLSIGAPRIG